MPFTTKLLAEFIRYRLALAIYWFNILALGAAPYWSWHYALRAGFGQIGDHPGGQFGHHIIGAQTLYAIGALACVWHTYLSIGIIILLQLYYAIAPRLPGIRRAETAG